MSKRWTFWMGRNEDDSFQQSGVSDGREAEPLGLNHGQNVGENIKRLRVNSGMTQQDLGDALGVSAQAVSKWENGLAAPDISLLVPVAAVFHVTLDTLFGLDPVTLVEPVTTLVDDADHGAERNPIEETLTEAFAPQDFEKQIEASVLAVVNQEEIQAQVRHALSSIDKDALRQSIQATIRASVQEAKRGIDEAKRELKRVAGMHEERPHGDDAHEHERPRHCVVCDSFYGEDERHCTGCHQNYGEDERHCTGCHGNYGEDDKHCPGCHQNYGENDQHCAGCHESYGEDDHHCPGCHETHGEDDQHCAGCHETYGEDDQHCVECHETYDEGERHCVQCHETYSEGERHLCA